MAEILNRSHAEYVKDVQPEVLVTCMIQGSIAFAPKNRRKIIYGGIETGYSESIKYVMQKIKKYNVSVIQT